MVQYCPGCYKADALSTPRSPTTKLGSRTTMSHGMRICNRCNIIIPKKDSDIKFWTGEIAVSCENVK